MSLGVRVGMTPSFRMRAPEEQVLWEDEAFSLVQLNFCFEMDFTSHNIHPFKIHKLVVFSIITKLCNHHHYLIPEHLHYSKRNLIPLSNQSLPVVPPYPLLCLFWTFHVEMYHN